MLATVWALFSASCITSRFYWLYKNAIHINRSLSREKINIFQKLFQHVTCKKLTGNYWLLLVAVPAANADLLSTFDTGTEGWTTTYDAYSIYYDSANQYVFGKDRGKGGVYYFDAPTTWNGDWSSYIGGTLEYDLKVLDTHGGGYFGAYEVFIESGSSYARWDTSLNPNTTSWTHYTVGLSEANLYVSGGSLADIMANVTNLRIRGEYTNAAYDMEALDNVSLSAPVPEPGTVLLLGAGLIGLAGARRRFKA